MEFGSYCLGMALSLDLSTMVVALLFAAQTSLLQTCSSEHLLPGFFFLPSCQKSVMALAEAGHLHRLLLHLVMCSVDTRCHVCNLVPSRFLRLGPV